MGILRKPSIKVSLFFVCLIFSLSVFPASILFRIVPLFPPFSPSPTSTQIPPLLSVHTRSHPRSLQQLSDMNFVDSVWAWKGKKGEGDQNCLRMYHLDDASDLILQGIEETTHTDILLTRLLRISAQNTDRREFHWNSFLTCDITKLGPTSLKHGPFLKKSLLFRK